MFAAQESRNSIKFEPYAKTYKPKTFGCKIRQSEYMPSRIIFFENYAVNKLQHTAQLTHAQRWLFFFPSVARGKNPGLAMQAFAGCKGAMSSMATRTSTTHGCSRHAQGGYPTSRRLTRKRVADTKGDCMNSSSSQELSQVCVINSGSGRAYTGVQGGWVGENFVSTC